MIKLLQNEFQTVYIPIEDNVDYRMHFAIKLRYDGYGNVVTRFILWQGERTPSEGAPAVEYEKFDSAAEAYNRLTRQS